MNLSNPRRLAKLCGQLLRKPRLIPGYLKTSLLRKSPLELQLPWWSTDAIRAVEKLVTPATTVFEYGTGGSTLFLARRTKTVKSVEDDEGWLQNTQDALDAMNLTNVTLCFEPYDFSNLKDFEKSSYLNGLDQSHDLIVIDGQDNYHFEQSLSARTICFRHAQILIEPGGAIVVDDSWRYPEIRKISACKNLAVHESTGPGRRGVTSTDIHHY